MKTPFGTEIAGDESRRKRKALPLIIGGLVLSLLVGGAFAATIQINGGDSIEFGQGNEAVVACDTDGLEPTITSSYNATTDAFTVASVAVDDLDDACSGKHVLVSLYQGSTLVDQILFSPTGDGTATSFSLDSEEDAGCTDVPASICGPVAGGTNGRAASVDSTLVDDFTVETFETAPSTSV